MGYKVVSLFSGAGGMDLGFINVGFDIIWANDFYKEAIQTYQYNIGNRIIFGDITKISSEEIPNDVDVVIGGFPCHGFSISNIKRSMKDSRNFLYREVLRVVRDKKPKVFVLENVKGLLSMENGEVIKMIVNDFVELGYKVDYKVLNAAKYGVPQMRERVIIIGNRIGVENKYPIETHFIDKEESGKLKCPTVSEVIGELSETDFTNKEYIEVNGKKIYNHIGYSNVKSSYKQRTFQTDQPKFCEYIKDYKKKKGLSNKVIAEILGYPKTKVEHWFRKDKYGSLPDMNDYIKLKELLELDNKYDEVMLTYEEKEKTFDQALRMTNWDRPSDTITATCSEIHINKKRRLSIREIARLQTFPDDFIFFGSLEKQQRQVGNAVPVELAKVVGLSVKDMLDNYSC